MQANSLLGTPDETYVPSTAATRRIADLELFNNILAKIKELKDINEEISKLKLELSQVAKRLPPYYQKLVHRLL